MSMIGEILLRDLNRKIEEIIMVDQADEQSVHDEITEYVATDSIRDQYAQLLKAIAEAPADLQGEFCVWVSGFFGSGKSSFAKNLGLALQNPEIVGEQFSTMFKRQIADERVSNLLDSINDRFPFEVLILVVSIFRFSF